MQLTCTSIITQANRSSQITENSLSTVDIPYHWYTVLPDVLHPCCLQRFRFTTSLLYTACVSCEFLTPRFPSHFLLLTAVSNVGRAVGLTTFVSTQPAFQQALCASGNMADLASKTQVNTERRVVCSKYANADCRSIWLP
jgi:hypothetical protein